MTMAFHQYGNGKNEIAQIVAFLKTLTGKQPDFKMPVMPPSTNDTPRPKPFG